MPRYANFEVIMGELSKNFVPINIRDLVPAKSTSNRVHGKKLTSELVLNAID